MNGSLYAVGPLNTDAINNYALTVKGNFLNNSTFTGNSSIVNLNGSSLQTISGTGTATFGTLKINNKAGVSLGKAVTITTLDIGNDTVNSIFNDGGYAITTANTLNLTSGTYNCAATGATAFPWATLSASVGTTVNYNGAGAQTAAGLIYDNLKINNSAGVTLGGATTINSGILTIGDVTGSSIFNDGGYAITTANTLNLTSGTYNCTVSGATAFPWSTLNANAGTTVNYGCAGAQTVADKTYENLTLSGSGLKTTSGSTTVNEILSMEGTATASATPTYGASSTLQYKGSSAQTTTDIEFPSSSAAPNLIINNTNGVTLHANRTVAGTLSITGAFNINPSIELTVNGTTTLNSAHCLVIQSDASNEGSFIDNGTISGGGSADVQRWVSTNASTDCWEYFSVPISAASSNLYASAKHKVYYGIETTNNWGSYAAGANVTLNPFTGYTRHYVYADGDVDGVVTNTGTLNTGGFGSSNNLTRTEAAPGKQHGWNLMGNPYPSSMDWDALSGWTKTHLISSVYYRKNGTFACYVSGYGTNGGTNLIPPMQAFWVRVDTTFTTGTLLISNSVRVHGSQNIYKTKSSNNTLHLTATNNTNALTDDTYVIFAPNATDGFDAQYDAYKMFAPDTAYPQLYTNNGNDMAINSLSDLVGKRDVALGFLTTLSGIYTLTADEVSSFTNNGNTVYLEDLVTSAYQDLSQNNTYQFLSGATSGFSRFILHFNPTVTDIKESTQNNNNVLIYSNKNEVHLNSLKALNGDVNIYDMLGQLVASKHVSGTTSAVITLNPVSAVYIVKYITSEQTTSARVFVNQ